MVSGRLPNPLPRGLYGRAALILVAPVVAIQLVVSVVFIQRHFEGVTEQMTESVLLELRHLVAEVNRADNAAQARAEIELIAGSLALDVALPIPPESDFDGYRRDVSDLSGRVVIATLRAGLPTLGGVDLVTPPDTVRVIAGTRHGDMLVRLDRRRVSASNPHQLLVWLVFTGLLMTLVAFVFLRNQLRPIRRLAQAAEAFGKGHAVPYRPRGAAEVRAAGHAFLDMRARIERQIEQRTRMLSGVSHDLRTPLTRLKLGLSMMDDTDEIAALQRDVADMEQLLDAFLAYARGEALDDPQPTDPEALVAELVEKARRGGREITFKALGTDGTRLPLRRQVLARAVENLVANALRYGSRAAVTLTREPRALRVAVEDDGPGIPAERRAEAVRPFTRLDAARNQDRGTGVGLGLAIALDAARSHGGTLELGDSGGLGGLRAELIIPL